MTFILSKYIFNEKLSKSKVAVLGVGVSNRPLIEYLHNLGSNTTIFEAKEKETGVTIHRVNAEYDSGEIVAQTTVPVLENDTPEILAARVLKKEHEFLVEVIADIAVGKIALG